METPWIDGNSLVTDHHCASQHRVSESSTGATGPCFSDHRRGKSDTEARQLVPQAVQSLLEAGRDCDLSGDETYVAGHRCIFVGCVARECSVLFLVSADVFVYIQRH